jgi:1-acyl-sn-glycerol-3-phosphate acyltransferase
MTWLRHAYHVLAVAFAFFYFGVGGLLFTVVGRIAHWLAPESSAAGRRTVSAAFRSFLGLLQFSRLVRLDIAALDALRSESRLIVAPNHPGLLDAVFVMARVPEIACILKAPLLGSPFIGGGARWSGHIRNDSGAGMVRQAAAELVAGGKLLVFPEGTRTGARDTPVSRFKGGFALIAREAMAPVQTVWIDTHPPFLGKRLPWWKVPALPLVVRVRLGRRFEPPQKDDDVKAWLREFERYFREELATSAVRAVERMTARPRPTANSSQRAARSITTIKRGC